jgi:hypothetical protein
MELESRCTLVCSNACGNVVISIVVELKTERLPSQGSGSVFAARSSMENLISWPFSKRDSGSAFMSQYWRPDEGGSDVASFDAVEAFPLVAFEGFYNCCVSSLDGNGGKKT